MYAKSGMRLSLPASEIAASSGYVPSLDGLRAFSISIVLVTHLISMKLAPGGFGVEVFFVISGFIIARLMFAEHKEAGQVSLGGFYERRIARLYPPLVLYVSVIGMVAIWTGAPFIWSQIVASLFYYANYYYLWFDSAHPGAAALPFGVFWSLAVEEHFYFIFPIFFIACAGRPGRLVVGLTGVVVACLALRLLAAHHHPALIENGGLHERTEFRLDAIAWGVMLAIACETPLGRRLVQAMGSPIWFGAALLTLLSTFALRDPVFRETWRYSLQGASLAIILAAIVFEPRYALLQIPLNHPWVIYLGKISYSLYVWHSCTPILSRWLFPDDHPAVQIVFEFAFSFLFAVSSYHFLEMPIARWRRGRSRRSRSSRLAAAAA